jgi:hypothetical protein
MPMVLRCTVIADLPQLGGWRDSRRATMGSEVMSMSIVVLAMLLCCVLPSLLLLAIDYALYHTVDMRVVALAALLSLIVAMLWWIELRWF